MGRSRSERPSPSPGPREKERAERLGELLTSWFDREATALPWRTTRDPYRIWVAEVLLQQTRVEQARPYFDRFLKTFPTLKDLASAPLSRVLKVWEGAGYYGRARRLHEAARLLLRERDGQLPSTAAELEELPGFGPYTSRSVAALAFGRPEVALDANGLRVLARIFLRDPEDPSLGPAPMETIRQLGRLALGEHDPRSFNEGLMELGQRSCRARSPLCVTCPVAAVCRSRSELPDPGAFPPPSSRSCPRPRVEAAVGIWQQGGRVLVAQRPPHGLLGGLWEFPGGKLERGETPEAAVVREFGEEVGMRPRHVRPLGRVEHDYSHFHVTLHVFGLEGPGEPRPTDGRAVRWVTPSTLRRLPLPRATSKMLPWVVASRAPKATAGGLSRRTSRGSGSRPGPSRA